ncbi:MAG: adenosylcobinamide-GDP ribazoletransferase [Candidatus Promineifilaceae bacterium]
MNGLFLALSFLTTLPVVPLSYHFDARHWRTAVFWFPIIGGLLGGLVWLVGWGSGLLFGGWVSAVLVAASWAALTGGLHLDGLADCCDGLLVMAEPARRLEILKDARLGAFGVIGLVLFLLLKVGAIQGVLARGHGLAFVAAAALGRAMILWVARQPPARSSGMGAAFAEQIQPFSLLLTTLLPVGLLFFLGWRGVVAVVGAVTAVFAIIIVARRRIGGVTGDVYGLTVEVVELVVLLTFAAR